MKTMMLIINPNAGRGSYKYNFAEAMELLSEKGYGVSLYYTHKRGDATEFTKKYGKEYDIVACVGGDGTLSEMLSGLMTLDNPPAAGYIPMGTANDVATTLGLPKNDILQAIKSMVEGELHGFDVGGFGRDHYFAYIAAFGAFTEVSYETPQNQKKALGHLAYVLQGMAQLPKIESIHTRVEYDEGCFEGDLLYGSMSNSTSVAGIVKLSEEMVSLGDGLSELVLVKNPETVDGFGEILASVLSRKFDSDNLVILHTKKAKFTFDKPVAWTRDGEAGGEYQEIELYNFQSPVNLIF